MKKKQYITPEIQSFEVKTTLPICTSVDSSDINMGGGYGPSPAPARRNGWDDYEGM